LHAMAPVAGGLIGLFASWRMLSNAPAEAPVELAP